MGISFNKAMQAVSEHIKVRRPCWQPGWVELGNFRGSPTPFLRLVPTTIDGFAVPETYVIYTPYRNHVSGYAEDEMAMDWELIT